MIPNIIPTAATGVMFTLLLNPTFGVLKSVYGIFGLDAAQIPNLFGNSKFAFWTVTCTWILYSGFNTIIFLAEMGAVDTAIYEAARGGRGKACRWTAISPSPYEEYLRYLRSAGICGMVSQFDIIYVTTKGGPGNSTLNLPTYLYKVATLENNYGKANAVGVIQIALGLVLVVFIQALFREKKMKQEGK